MEFSVVSVHLIGSLHEKTAWVKLELLSVLDLVNIVVDLGICQFALEQDPNVAAVVVVVVVAGVVVVDVVDVAGQYHEVVETVVAVVVIVVVVVAVVVAVVSLSGYETRVHDELVAVADTSEILISRKTQPRRMLSIDLPYSLMLHWLEYFERNLN